MAKSAEQLLDAIEAWANDRGLPSNSEFIQGYRTAQDRVQNILVERHPKAHERVDDEIYGSPSEAEKERTR